jgi:hypothetical protein
MSMHCSIFEFTFDSKFGPSVLENVGLRVPGRYIKGFSVFNVSSSSKNCPSTRCAAAANAVCRGFDVFVLLIY